MGILFQKNSENKDRYSSDRKRLLQIRCFLTSFTCNGGFSNETMKLPVGINDWNVQIYLLTGTSYKITFYIKKRRKNECHIIF
jgi:hypothetical protein